MEAGLVRSGWVGRLGLFVGALSFVLTGCATAVVRAATATGPAATVTQSDDDDFSQLVAQLRSDLSRSNKREAERREGARA